MDLYALLVFFAPLVAAVAGNGVDTQIAIWFPNPCDSFGNLPKSLQRAFLQYKEQNNVVNLDSIDAYRRYTVASIEPEATDTWGWNRRDATPTVTSAYNTAGCSTYYPPPTTGRHQPTELATTGTNSIPQTATISLNLGRTEVNTDTMSQGQRITGQLTAARGTAPTTLLKSKTEISSTIALGDGGKSHGTTTTTATTTAPTTAPTTATTTATTTTTTTVEQVARTHTLKPVPTGNQPSGTQPSGIQPTCWPEPTGKLFQVDIDWLKKSIRSACSDLQNNPPLSSDIWWPKESPFDDTVHRARVYFALESHLGGKPLALAPGSGSGFDACYANFYFTWDTCTKKNWRGGVLLYDEIEWTVSVMQY